MQDRSAPRSRRRLLAAAAALAAASAARRARADTDRIAYDAVLPGRPLRFPRDHGAHPGFRTEWWYVTGWLDVAGRAVGFQVTFFRSRTHHAPENPSLFAPRQLLLAHAALAISGRDALVHDQRAARAGFGLARASEGDTHVILEPGWKLTRSDSDRYHAGIEASGFALDLHFTPTGPPVPQGDGGYSRKGPRPEQASHYYSRPQLAVSGRIALPTDLGGANAGGAPASQRNARAGARRTGPGAWQPVTGLAWLDHEWSSTLLDAAAVGWDWVGLNFDDGSALMAFRIRGRDGAVVWADARWIDPQGRTTAALASPRFTATRLWRSPASGAQWPVAMRIEIETGAGLRRIDLTPLMDDQELDTRASTGTIYWEGAVRAREAGRETGRGYLELTGYAGALRL